MKTKTRKHLYIALCKPIQAQCWLPMSRDGIAIISITKKGCLARARAAKTQAWLRQYSPRNRFNKVEDWHVMAAKVTW
jgi:hypothetical protein